MPNGDSDFQIANIRIFPVLHMGVKEKNDNHNQEKRGSVAVLQLLQLFQSTAIFAPIQIQRRAAVGSLVVRSCKRRQSEGRAKAERTFFWL